MNFVVPKKLFYGLAALFVFNGVALTQNGAAFAQVSTQAETQSSIAQRMSADGAQDSTSKTDSDALLKPDLAFGAFQRGKYLTAFELALPRAKLGDPAAQTLVAEMYDKGLGVARNFKESTAWYELAAGNNDLEAQFSYAVKLLEGKYVKGDPKQARILMKKAAEGGHTTAAYNYGQMILDERPTAAGVKQALPFFEIAANARVADAYYTLAKLYESGRLKGYPEYKVAQEWMLKAARAGVDTAQVELSIWLANGKAGTKDPKISFQWMKRAAVGGNVIGQSRIAKMYLQGIGTDVNVIEGVKWHIIARRAGLNDQWLDKYVGSLDEKELSAALEAANRWPS